MQYMKTTGILTYVNLINTTLLYCRVVVYVCVRALTVRIIGVPAI